MDTQKMTACAHVVHLLWSMCFCEELARVEESLTSVGQDSSYALEINGCAFLRDALSLTHISELPVPRGQYSLHYE